MARKFLNREEKKGLDDKKEVSAEDEWAHLTGEEESDSVETKIEKKVDAAEAMDVLDRSITFGQDQQEGPRTKYDVVIEEARNAMDAAGNTGQYIRFVNRHIDSQKKEIEKIKKIKEKFDHEIDLLQANRTKINNINKKLLPQHDVKNITESLHQLLLEKGITKNKLDILKKEIDTVEKELEQQEEQIEEVSEDLKSKKMLSNNSNAELHIKEELSTLMKKYGVSNLSDLEKLMK